MATKTKMKHSPKRIVDEDAAFSVLRDDEADSMGEEFVATATSGEFIGEDARDEIAEDELGVTTIVEIAEPEAEEAEGP